MEVLGIVLIALGIIIVVFGVAGGIAHMIKELRREAAAQTGFDPIGALEKLLKALTEFLKALVTAPTWLALVIIGFAAIGYGGWFLAS